MSQPPIELISAVKSSARAGDSKSQYVLDWMLEHGWKLVQNDSEKDHGLISSSNHNLVHTSSKLNSQRTVGWKKKSKSDKIPRLGYEEKTTMDLVSIDSSSHEPLDGKIKPYPNEILHDIPPQDKPELIKECLSNGYTFYNGKWEKKSLTLAAIWYWLAADMGDSISQCQLGTMYANGEGVTQSHVEAVKWYRLSADQGFSLAQYLLSQYYLKGLVVPQSNEEAAKLLQKPAEEGDKYACEKLGLLYKSGCDIRVSYKGAVKLFRKAAEQGLASSQYNLGLMYEDGKGVPKSSIDAANWYKLAADQGHKDAKIRLESILETQKKLKPMPAPKVQSSKTNQAKATPVQSNNTNYTSTYHPYSDYFIIPLILLYLFFGGLSIYYCYQYPEDIWYVIGIIVIPMMLGLLIYFLDPDLAIFYSIFSIILMLIGVLIFAF